MALEAWLWRRARCERHQQVLEVRKHVAQVEHRHVVHAQELLNVLVEQKDGVLVPVLLDALAIEREARWVSRSWSSMRATHMRGPCIVLIPSWIMARLPTA